MQNFPETIILIKGLYVQEAMKKSHCQKYKGNWWHESRLFYIPVQSSSYGKPQNGNKSSIASLKTCDRMVVDSVYKSETQN